MDTLETQHEPFRVVPSSKQRGTGGADGDVEQEFRSFAQGCFGGGIGFCHLPRHQLREGARSVEAETLRVVRTQLDGAADTFDCQSG